MLLLYSYILKIVYNGSPMVPTIIVNNNSTLTIFRDGPIMVHDGTRTSTITKGQGEDIKKFTLSAIL